MKPQDILPRLVLAAAVAGAVGYVFTWNGAAAEGVSTAVKGTGVGLLALYCAMLARELDGWLIAVVMLLGMLGDVLLNAAGLTTGALAFLAGHVVAIILYRRNARAPLTRAAILGGVLFIAGVAAFAAWLPQDAEQAPGIAFYSAGLALMAACAWLSRFPRSLVGAGALLFLVSDLLIFARIGPLQGQPWVGYGVWGLYFAGQLMIAVGVTRTLAVRG